MSCTTDYIIGIGSQLFAEAIDMDIDGAIGNDYTCPKSIHELLARKDMPLVGEEHIQKVELCAGETDWLGIDGDGLTVKVHLKALEGKISFAKSRLYHVHYIIAKPLAIGNDICVKRAKSIRIMLGIHVF